MEGLLGWCPDPPCDTHARDGYQKFSQELLSNGPLNHLPLKERMVEIGNRWHRISQARRSTTRSRPRSSRNSASRPGPLGQGERAEDPRKPPAGCGLHS